MAPFGYVDVEAFVDNGPDIAVVDGNAREIGQHVELRRYAGVELYGRNVARQRGRQLCVEARLEGVDLVLGRQNLLFIFFQLGSDIAFGVDECLLAYPLLGNLVAVGVGDFEIISENVVVGYFKARDAGQLYLAAAYGLEVVFGVDGDVAQLVEGFADACADNSAAR